MASITIHGLPDEVRDELAARAAREGRSLQGYLRAELIKLARRPSVEDVLRGARARKGVTVTRLSAEQILSFRDADRH